MSEPDESDRFLAHLRRQLDFLRRSCDAYDAGHAEEALRISAILRTLLHDTQNSTSLLAHLRVKDKILLLSTTRGAPGAVLHFNGILMMRSVDSGFYVRPKLEGGWRRFISVEAWLEQVVYVIDRKPFSRKRVILLVAEKDGGVHVDAKLPMDYRALVEPGSLGAIIKPDGEFETREPIRDAPLAALRQMGFELLNSPDLTALAQR